MFYHCRSLVFAGLIAFGGMWLGAPSVSAQSDPAALGSVMFIDFSKSTVNIHTVVKNESQFSYYGPFQPDLYVSCYLAWDEYGVRDYLAYEPISYLGPNQYHFADILNIKFSTLLTLGMPRIVVELVDHNTGQTYAQSRDINIGNNKNDHCYPIY